jgi:malate dehydrogenase (oxaloacetate-decarboxylating)
MKNRFEQIAKQALALHKKYHGKFAVASKVPRLGPDELKLIYTPGVGAVSSYVAKHKDEVRAYTMKGNSVAIVSDGSAVLGLGNLGPEGALPVMEGKALLFKKFADIDAVPIVLATQDTEEIIRTVKAIAPTFGGINLEDISAPRCFEIEARLRRELDIPVMHDDQHGTAIVILAGLTNALKVVGKKLGSAKIVLSGAGAAGTAIAKIITLAGGKNILVCDSHGILSLDREGLTSEKKKLAEMTNPQNERGALEDAMRGADVFIGVSAPGIVSEAMVRSMNKKAIVFALANPIPEIMPDLAKRAGAAVVATGRSDFPNQLNNSLAFPGVFRGALDNGVREITEQMKLRAAKAIAGLIKKPTSTSIVPTMFDKRLVRAVSVAIRD